MSLNNISIEEEKAILAEMRGADLSKMLTVLKPIKITNTVSIRPLMPQIVCADGTKLSVQASEHHYSSPRNNFGPYKAVEVGFPTSEVPSTWLEYAEDKDNPLRTVYAYIPIELVHFYIGAHGGIDYDKTLKGYRPVLR